MLLANDRRGRQALEAGEPQEGSPRFRRLLDLFDRARDKGRDRAFRAFEGFFAGLEEPDRLAHLEETFRALPGPDRGIFLEVAFGVLPEPDRRALLVIHSDDLGDVRAEYAAALSSEGRDRLEGLIRTAYTR